MRCLLLSCMRGLQKKDSVISAKTENERSQGKLFSRRLCAGTVKYVHAFFCYRWRRWYSSTCSRLRENIGFVILWLWRHHWSSGRILEDWKKSSMKTRSRGLWDESFNLEEDCILYLSSVRCSSTNNLFPSLLDTQPHGRLVNVEQ